MTVQKNETISLRFVGETEKDIVDSTRFVEFLIPDCTYNGDSVLSHLNLYNGYTGCTINDDALEASRH